MTAIERADGSSGEPRPGPGRGRLKPMPPTVETPIDMPFPMTDLGTPWPAAIAIVLAAIGIT
ncbi:MAG: hypothetical protein ACRENJ_03520, partial [Candidatus Eiseniibacteriota bacterium]